MIGRREHLLLVGFKLLHLARELGQFFLEVRRLRGECFGGFLQIGGVELREITRNALFQLLATSLDFACGKVHVARIDRLEFRTVDRDARFRQQAHLPAQIDELRADLLELASRDVV